MVRGRLARGRRAALPGLGRDREGEPVPAHRKAGRHNEHRDEDPVVARLEGGRYAPSLAEADTLELARAAASRLGEKATASGAGAAVRIDRDPVERGLAGLAICALRHGGLERVELTADGSSVWIEPVVPSAAPIVLGEDLKDLGAAAARRVVEALGGSFALEGERLQVHLPT